MFHHPHLTAPKLAAALLVATGTLAAIEMMGWQSQSLYLLGGPIGAFGLHVAGTLSVLAIIPPFQGRARPAKDLIGVILASLALVAVALWVKAHGTAPRLGTGVISTLTGWGVWLYATLPEEDVGEPAPCYKE